MKSRSKKIIAQILAGMLVFSCVATSCDQDGYVESGTTVKFDYNDGSSRPYSVVADEGETVASPATPVREGYEFSHWQTAKDGGDTVSFPYTPTDDVTLYAAWTVKNYTVTFDMNYNNDSDIEKSIPYEQTVTAPTEAEMPTRNGYEFFAWQNKPEGGTDITFPYTVTKDVTFYAIWSQGGIFTVNFDTNYDGGEEFEAARVMAGKALKIKDMPKPKRSGYTFEGWATSANATVDDVLDSDFEPTEDTTLYAVWEIITYTVNFKYNYVGKPAANYSQVKGLLFGATVAEPEGTPTRPGHTFTGWYTTAQGGTRVEFPLTVEKGASYYAHWLSDAVTTDTFHAEFTELDPLETFPGYSGSAQGAGIITGAGAHIEGLVHSESDYQTNTALTVSEGHFVTYLYKRGATVTFKIYATAAASNVTLQASLATEFVTGITVEPTGDFAWKLMVNRESINYSPITFNGELNGSTNASPFQMYTLASNINLVEGENIIQFVTDNSNPIIGGTTAAFAPMIDCIKFSNTGAASLSYHPVYDNLWYGSLG